MRRGIMPDAGGCYLLPRIVGLSKAKEIMFFGDDLPAAEADRLGIANTRRARRRRSARSPTSGPAAWPRRRRKAITMTKWLLNRSIESSRQTSFEEEAYAQELVRPPRTRARACGRSWSAATPTSRAGRTQPDSAGRPRPEWPTRPCNVVDAPLAGLRWAGTRSTSARRPHSTRSISLFTEQCAQYDG